MDSDATETAVVADYLGRLHAASWGLAPARREELVAEVREHIDDALRAEREAGRRGEAVVRNVLERLGPPEEIVRAESESQSYDVRGAAPSGQAPIGAPGLPAAAGTSYDAGSWWGPVEIFAVLLLSLGSVLLPLVGPVTGLVLLWMSPRWTQEQKVVGSFLGLLPFLALFLVLV